MVIIVTKYTQNHWSPDMSSTLDRRELMKLLGASAGAVVISPFASALASNQSDGPLRVGVMADPHYAAWRGAPDRSQLANDLRRQTLFLERMRSWRPDVVVCLGDYVVPRVSGEHNMTALQHVGMVEDIEVFWPMLHACPCPTYVVPGNHDVGWIRGGEEHLSTQDLIDRGRGGGHALSKTEWARRLGMPGRFFAFDAKGYRIIVLDGNNTQDSDVANDKDGVRGAYWIDQPQLVWLGQELARHRGKTKLVFCHQELHHTCPNGSSQGGWTPLPVFHKDGSYVGNGWQVRQLFEEDGNVAACFHGHYHMNRWTVYGGIHYITLDNERGSNQGNWAELTLEPDRLRVNGHALQASYDLPVPASDEPTPPPPGTVDAALERRREYQVERG